MKQFFRCFCYFLAAVLPLAAQPEAGRSSGRSAWFACLSTIPPGLDNPMKVMGGEQLTEVELPAYMTSAPVKIPEDGVVSIVRAVPDPANPEKATYVVQAQAKIPENMREALILLLPLPKPQGDVLFHARVQDLASFKGGDRLFINLSATPVRVSLGETKVTVAPAQSNIYRAPNLDKPANIPIMYEFHHPERNEWRILTASTVVLRPTRREICVFNDGTRPGNIKKHGILFPVQSDTREDNAPPAPTQ